MNRLLQCHLVGVFEVYAQFVEQTCWSSHGALLLEVFKLCWLNRSISPFILEFQMYQWSQFPALNCERKLDFKCTGIKGHVMSVEDMWNCVFKGTGLWTLTFSFFFFPKVLYLSYIWPCWRCLKRKTHFYTIKVKRSGPRLHILRADGLHIVILRWTTAIQSRWHGSLANSDCEYKRVLWPKWTHTSNHGAIRQNHWFSSELNSVWSLFIPASNAIIMGVHHTWRSGIIFSIYRFWSCIHQHWLTDLLRLLHWELC